MGVFILILLLVAAIFGVLGAVLKFALVLVLGLVLGFTLLAWGLWFAAKRRVSAWQREMEVRATQNAQRQRALDIRYVENEAQGEGPDGDPPDGDPLELGAGDS